MCDTPEAMYLYDTIVYNIHDMVLYCDTLKLFNCIIIIKTKPEIIYCAHLYVIIIPL